MIEYGIAIQKMSFIINILNICRYDNIIKTTKDTIGGYINIDRILTLDKAFQKFFIFNKLDKVYIHNQ